MSLLKDFMDPTHHRFRRRTRGPEHLDYENAEATVEPQRQLAVLVRDATMKIAEHMGEVAQAHSTLMQGLQRYFGLDVSGVDTSAMALVQECASVTESFEQTLKKAGFAQVMGSCDEILKECSSVAGLLNERDDALSERQHYEEKVATLRSVSKGVVTEQIARNQEKLERAKESHHQKEDKLTAALQSFIYRRPVHFRQTLLALFRQHVGVLAEVGAKAEEAMKAVAAELQVGQKARIVGLQKAVELNELLVTVEGEEGAGRLFVQLPDGRQKSVRVENLCPQLPEPQEAQEPSSSSKVGESGQPGEDSALPQKLRLEPACIPCSGAEVVIEARDLAGTISEVWVDGTSCEVLEDLSKRDSPSVRVRVPACRNRAGGAALVEVRSVDWARHMIREEAAKYFPLLTFATCSPNIELTSRQGDDTETPYLDVATRQKGLISAVALTSELSPVQGRQRYFFQVKIEAMAEKRSNRTLALGFVWPLPHALLLEGDDAPQPQLKRRASLWSSDGHMPELAHQLPRCLVAYMGGRELAKIAWRPLLECIVGAELGVVLDEGEEKCVVEGPLSEEWRWPSLGAPNGVLDVCGTVTSVSLSQGAQPPYLPLSLTEDAAQEGAEKRFERHDKILQQRSTPERAQCPTAKLTQHDHGKMPHEERSGVVSLDQAADSSGWPEQVLKDVCKQPFVVESPESFLSFVRYADHSQAQMCILRDGLQKLALETSLPQALREACTQHRTAVEAVLAFQDASDFELDGDVFTWPGTSGGYSCKRTEIKGGSMCQRLTRAKAAETDDGLIYVAELNCAKKTAHHFTGERCRTLTNKDVRDCADVSFHPCTDVVELPMWDRGHSFVGAPGVGSCLHVDQAWWSNVAKNFTGQKLVALWGPGDAEEIVQRHEGELFRRPLSPEQTQALSKAAVIALLQPGDVASFSGGLPHATVVVGTELNLTAYESLVNWHPANAGLLLRGLERRGKGVMTRKAKEGLLEDIVEVVKRHASVEAPGLWDEDQGRVLLLQLGSSNDDKGKVDGEVQQRAVKTTSLWRALTAAGQHVSVLVSGGADPNRFFNRTSTSHWRYVRQALLDCGLPAEHIVNPGLEALHTVDEALMAVEYVREHSVGRLWVITSDFHAARARHLFHVAFVSAGLSVDLLVLGVPDACEGEVLQAYKAKEVKALEGLRSAPYGAWATYLSGAAEPAVAAELNADRRVHEPFFLTAAAAGNLRGAFRAVLKGSRRCRRFLETEDGGSAEFSDSGTRSDLSEKAREAKKPRLSGAVT
ncbi:spoVK [Symbiodinium sp. CCMP2592]|nr:spoVK [Symbiodinium sp. CCMP2592]